MRRRSAQWALKTPDRPEDRPGIAPREGRSIYIIFDPDHRPSSNVREKFSDTGSGVAGRRFLQIWGGRGGGQSVFALKTHRRTNRRRRI